MNDRIARAWDSFALTVLPADAPDVQRVEMRRAFYAGAWAMFTELTGPEVSDVPDEQSMQVVQALHDECVEFKDALLRGEA